MKDKWTLTSYRTRILIKDKSGLALNLAQEVEDLYPIVVLQAPQEGLVMVKLREKARQSQFYLGEVVVTETKVQIEEQLGLGIVKGHDENLSKALAIIDAAYKAGLPITRNWQDAFIQADNLIKERQQEEISLLAQTKVNFQSMMEEDYL
ncbi:phosphonate C-P lyase system protein PhnG [Spirochaeta cellobiosiphila]|uniref:phosphonate C-P lyase system protein PhnG n=1 Tax=Spirochaeta cellobiosiphila TaxID=504483 RepID=UPI00041F7054|nr:phosphonate C-P lyase system protein PhnG [Spirochaeta cellobiosiphila]